MKSLYLSLVSMSLSFSVYGQPIINDNSRLVFTNAVFGQNNETNSGSIVSSADPPSVIVTLNGYNGTIPLVWSSVTSTNFNGYNIYRSRAQSGSYSKIASNIEDQYYRDESVANGIPYFYKIKAVDASGESNFSETRIGIAREDGYTIHSTFTNAPPTLDGIISPGEWSQATTIDMLYPALTEKVTLYVFNGQDKLFFAVDDHESVILEQFDTIGLFFDEDRDREWSAVSGDEGLVQVYWDNSSNSAKNRFYAFHGKWPAELSAETSTAVPGITQNISISSGHVQTEIAIDLEDGPLESSPGSIIGLLIYAYDGGSGKFTGLWPQATVTKLDVLTEGYGWSHAPFSYGDLRITAESQHYFWADVDEDGDVDIFDIQLVAAQWHTYFYDENYNSKYDVNGDGEIDIFDIQMVAYWWNKPIPDNSDFQRQKTINYAQNLTVRIEPQQTTAGVNKAVSIEVMIENATNLGAFQFDLIYDTAVVHAETAEMGTFLGSTSRTVIPVGPDIDNSAAFGKLTFGGATFGTNAGPNGNGVLATITFSTQAVGETEISIENVQVSDINGQNLSIGSVVNGQIDVRVIDTVSDKTNTKIPERFSLLQNYPNPFNPATVIRFNLPVASRTTLEIYDTVGRKVQTLIDADLSAGEHNVVWRPTTAVSGIYYYALRASHKNGRFAESKKLIFLK